MKSYLLTFFLLSFYANAIPVFDFFNKGSKQYYQTNNENIQAFLKTRLKINLKTKNNKYQRIFNLCREQYEHFGFSLIEGLKTNLYKAKFGLDNLQISQIEFFCHLPSSAIDSVINLQMRSLDKLKSHKLKLSENKNYYFIWDILAAKLNIFSVIKTSPPTPYLGKIPINQVKFFPVYLTNIATNESIYFFQFLDSRKANQIHILINNRYPLSFNTASEEFEFSVLENSPGFYFKKTQLLFEEFNKEFGIIPDRMSIIGHQPLAVIP